ncbi:gas vesicle protein GvpG [Thiocapsa rosea]|uniref:Gas vesicle protein GvpG n=1 Tax=Thiocapsa rosea TaxID=69360 RepID=A0A495V9X6_9GAMM|nr:gas vesicle protein GvpG [Thiocapsa rosea]RKT46119.1 gas vesicle protein GvpG [Thiocapsa rosea]
MLIVDDLLAAPFKGIIWVFEEIHKSATAEQRARRDEIMAALSALYRALEQGEITDDTFDTREQALLDELDALDAREDANELGSDEDEDDLDGAGEDAS